MSGLTKYFEFNKNRSFYALLAFFLGANALIISIIRLFPFIDIPFHLAVGVIFKYYGAEGNLFDTFYLIPSLLKSNIFHLIFVNLPFLGDVESANKIFYLLYSVLFPLSVLFLIRTFGGNSWFTLLSFFYVFNFVCAWGFTGNTISLPLFFFNLGIYYRFFYEKKNTLLIAVFFMNLLIFFSHLQTAIFSLFFFLLLSLLFLEKNFRYYIKIFTVAVPLIFLMAYVYNLDASDTDIGLVGYLISYFRYDFLTSLFEKVQLLFINEHYHWAAEPFGGLIGTLISFIVMIPLFVIALKKNFRFKEKNKKNHFLLALILSSLIFYFVLPFDIPGQNIVSYRFSIYFFIGLIVFLSLQNYNARFMKIYFTALSLSLLIFTGYSAEYFLSFQKENINFDKEFFSELNPSDRLGGLIYVPDYRGRPVYIHYNNYYTVWNRGISTGYVDYRYAFLKRKVDKNVLPPPNEWIAVFNKYNDEFSGIEYVLCRDTVLRGIPNFKPEKINGEWILYKNFTKNNFK
jgi:hypothetical protein